MTAKTELEHLLRIVTPEGGAQPEFHFYAARGRGMPVFIPPSLDGDTRPFLLSDEAWDYHVDVFEMRLRLPAAEVPGALLRGLENLVAQGAPLAWLMFDGAFDGVSSLATGWGTQNTYGIAGVLVPPCLALAEAERAAESWRTVVRRAVQGFSQQRGARP